MHLISTASTAILVALATPSAADDRTLIGHLTIDQLKSGYLNCERAQMAGALSISAIMQCSVVYEELKHKAFYSDSEKLRVWVREQLPPPQDSGERLSGKETSR